ncbi:MAG: CHAT domain-containing protein [Cyclobacteriaceae bacterium]|nr:CHAT domain-containing protein [Cyclobacteriaceae bacterium]
MITRICTFILLLSLTYSYGQEDLLGRFGKKLTKKLTEKGSNQVASLDSVDFQFAISLNQTAGFFDVEQKGETGATLLYQLKEESDKTKLELARENLETGIGLFEYNRYKMAELYVLETKAMLEQDGLTNELVYLRTISNLGLIYLVQGKVLAAESLITESLSDSEKALGKNSAAYVANLNNYAKLHQSLGKYNEAEKEFNEALQLCEAFFGDGMQKAIILNNKAMLLHVMGRYEEAFEQMHLAMKSSEVAPKKFLKSGENSFDNRKFRANLATMYQLSGRYEEAEQNFLAIKKVFENRGQSKNIEYAGLLNQLGILYIQMGKNELVRDLLVQSGETYRKRFGDQNVYFAKVLNDLGNFYRQTGNYEGAEKQLTRAYEVRGAILEPLHPDYIRTQEDLAILYWKTNRPEEAYKLYKEVMDKTVDFTNRYFPPMSEAEKTKFWDVTAPRFQRFYNFSLENKGAIKALETDFYNYHITTKALLINSTNKVKQAILNSSDATLKRDYINWLDQKEQLAQMYGFSKEKLNEQNINLPELERQVNAMERSLSEKSSLFTAGYSAKQTDYSELLNLLGDNEAIVDIVRVRVFDQDFKDEVKYVAFVLKKGSGVQVIELDNGTQLETRYVKYYRTAIQQRLPDEYSYNQFWSRIEPAVAGKKVLYVSPDGVYSQLNLNTLKNDKGEYNVNKYDIAIVGNAKDLIDIKARKSQTGAKSAFLLGFPDYATDAVPPLPGTKVELENITKVLKSANYTITQRMQKEATEKSIKSIKAPMIVHIATHGYFLQDVKSSQGSVYGVDAENASNNPLLRSGLILADAKGAINKSPSDISGNENGILTAYEAMNLDLEGTDLVIMSACETGLGDVKSGEGVYGLQRSFLVAGADALIMSLWKVDDEATQLLMSNFYSNWIKGGNKQKAFKQAQVQLMAKYKEPYYWGAFVMIGL